MIGLTTVWGLLFAADDADPPDLHQRDDPLTPAGDDPLLRLDDVLERGRLGAAAAGPGRGHVGLRGRPIWSRPGSPPSPFRSSPSHGARTRPRTRSSSPRRRRPSRPERQTPQLAETFVHSALDFRVHEGVGCFINGTKGNLVPRKGPRNRALSLFLAAWRTASCAVCLLGRRFFAGRRAPAAAARPRTGSGAPPGSAARRSESGPRRGSGASARRARLPVARDGRLRVVDLVLGAEDHQQRHVRGGQALVERRLDQRSPARRRDVSLYAV